MTTISSQAVVTYMYVHTGNNKTSQMQQKQHTEVNNNVPVPY